MSGACEHQEETKEWQALTRDGREANTQLAITDGPLTRNQRNPDEPPPGANGQAALAPHTHDGAGRPYRTTRSVHCGAKEN